MHLGRIFTRVAATLAAGTMAAATLASQPAGPTPLPRPLPTTLGDLEGPATIEGMRNLPEPTHVGSIASTEAVFWDLEDLERTAPHDVTDDRRAYCGSDAAATQPCLWSSIPMGSLPYAVVSLAAGEAGLQGEVACGAFADCHPFTIDVTEVGTDLRFAYDVEDFEAPIFLVGFDPTGAQAFTWRAIGGEVWLNAADPATTVGTWTVVLVVVAADGLDVRLRAALDPQDGPTYRVGPDGHAVPEQAPAPVEPSPNSPVEGGLLPNLQIYPPYEIGFAPCQATERIDYDAQRCLRFSTGPSNVGDGPLDLWIRDVGQVEGQGWQRIHTVDGGAEFVPAGTYVWHTEHSHFHHEGIAGTELLKVLDVDAGTMEVVGVGPKLGFCMGDYVMGEWTTFRQDRPHGAYDGDDTGCTTLDPPRPTQIALSRGWADIYSWWVEGNYAEFGDNADGLYVLRVRTDPDDEIFETDEDDNVAYAMFTVTGDEVEVLERGYGLDPFDPDKLVEGSFRQRALQG